MASLSNHDTCVEMLTDMQSKLPWRGYYELTRLHKPLIGNAILFWPCAWGLTMSAYSVGLPVHSFLSQLATFAIGCIFLHGAICTLNDLCDIEFDKQVERTKNRPLAAGVISVPGALIFLVTQSCLSVAVLMTGNSVAVACGVLGIFPLHAFYPMMKRWTWWPQAWLGLAMNWGIPTAWLSVSPHIATAQKLAVACAFLGSVCWTIMYDTMYACQDKEDDKKLGLKSTAILFGDRARIYLTGFAVAVVLSMVLAGVFNGQGIAYYTISCGGAAAHLAWQLSSWDINNGGDSAAKYQSNGVTGLILWAGMLADYYLAIRGTI